MQESIVEFETAKLAKEKGFNWEIRTYFDFKKFGIKPVEFFNKLNANNYSHWDFNLNKKINAGYISAPTQSLLQKWLREKHKLIVIVSYQYEPDSTSYSYWIYKENKPLPLNQWIDDLYTYEEALESGLFEALKLI